MIGVGKRTYTVGQYNCNILVNNYKPQQKNSTSGNNHMFKPSFNALTPCKITKECFKAT